MVGALTVARPAVVDGDGSGAARGCAGIAGRIGRDCLKAMAAVGKRRCRIGPGARSVCERIAE